jgi:hypothetical protein
MQRGDPRLTSPILPRLAAAMLSAELLALQSGVARAQGVDEFGAYGGLERADGQESPQDLAVELRFGRYLPQVDREFDGAREPFEETFGDDSRYLLGLELDWQALRLANVGTLGPGVGWGYTKATADSRITGTSELSQQPTVLNIMPLYVVAVLRADYLARETPVPLVAYAKGGLGYALWWSTGGDRLTREDGVVGQGSSYGLQFALGGMVLLDSLDRESAIEMDNSTGINNTYFFLEWYNSNLDCFGGDCMQVGANTWMLGLAFEM